MVTFLALVGILFCWIVIGIASTYLLAFLVRNKDIPKHSYVMSNPDEGDYEFLWWLALTVPPGFYILLVVGLIVKVVEPIISGISFKNIIIKQRESVRKKTDAPVKIEGDSR